MNDADVARVAAGRPHTGRSVDAKEALAANMARRPTPHCRQRWRWRSVCGRAAGVALVPERP